MAVGVRALYPIKTEVERLSQIKRASPGKEGAGFIVAKNPGRQMEMEFIDKPGLKQRQPEAAPAPVAENAAAEATPAAGQVTPVAGALQEFASGMGETAPTSVSAVHVYKAGQRPAQTLDELAASLAAQAAGEGTVRVITTRQVNGSGRSRSGRAHPTVRRAAAGSTTVAGRNQGQASAHAVDQAPAQPMEQAMRQPAGQPAPLANQPAGSRPGQLSAAAHTPRAGSRPNPAGQPLANQTPGPAAMNVSVEGIGTGSELASNTASGRGIPATEAGETALN